MKYQTISLLALSLATFNAHAGDEALREYFDKRNEFLRLVMDTDTKTNAIKWSTLRVLQGKYVEKCETYYGKENKTCSELDFKLRMFLVLNNNYDDLLISIGSRYEKQYDEIVDHSDTLASCRSEQKLGKKNCDEMLDKLINSSDESFSQQLHQELEFSKVKITDTYETFMVEIKRELTTIVEYSNEYSHQNGYDIRLDNIEEDINDVLKYVVDHSLSSKTL